MKILWLGRKKEVCNMPTFPNLRESLEKITDFTFDSVTGFDVNHWKPKGFDVVIVGACVSEFEDWKGLETWNIPKAMICNDPQSDFHFHKYYAKKYNVNLMLLIIDYWVSFYRKRLSCQVEWLPYSLKDIFVNTQKDIDVMYGISNGPLYPIRMLMKDDKRLVKFSRVPFGIGDVRYEWSDYRKFLNRSKILIADNSAWNYVLLKWLEGFSAKSLVLSQIPPDGEKMNLKPYYNFVPISKDNYFDKISEYLNNEEERRRIAERGRETFLEYHTADIRAKQLLKIIEDVLNV